MTEQLYKAALRARKFAHCPYSKFAVGAALLAESGNIYTGCNVENSAYGPSLCAERVAFGKAISEGEKTFKAIAIVGGPRGWTPSKPCFPCGTCRQVMKEFCDEDFQIILFENDVPQTYTLSQILPYAFAL